MQINKSKKIMIADVSKRAVGVFPRRGDIENALKELQNSGFAMDRVSVITQDADHNESMSGAEVKEQFGDKSDEGAKLGAFSGVTLGGLTGLLVGLGILAIPGVGPIMLAGATATTLATTLAGAGIGAVAGSLIGGLIGLGIPEERAKVYNERVQQGQYLVIIDGTDAEIAQAEIIFKRLGVEEFDIYQQPNESNLNPNHVSPMKRAIGIFSHNRDAQTAVSLLKDAGYPIEKISFIAKDREGDSGIADINRSFDKGNRANEAVKLGAFTVGKTGGLRDSLVGVRTLAIPGIGPVIVGGSTATALAIPLTDGTADTTIPDGSLAGRLIDLGIPKDKARVYSDHFNRGDYLLLIDGTDAEINQAEVILIRQKIEDFNIYDATVIGNNNYQLHDQDIHQQTPFIDSTHTNYSEANHNEDPSVIIIDRRSEIL